MMAPGPGRRRYWADMFSPHAATAAIIAMLFVASLFRSAFGFGEALLAVPMLAFVMPVQAAVPLAVLASVVIAGIVVFQDWRNIHLRSAGWLLVAALCGLPLGLWVLKQVPERVVERGLGAVIVLFALYSLLDRHRSRLHNDRLAWLFGFTAGVLGGAYGINGPPLVVYGTLRRWTPVHFRATLQAYFLPVGLVSLTGYWLTGLWTAEVSHDFLVSLPAILLATVAGRELNRRLHPQRFIVYVHGGLLALGVLLLWRARSAAQ